MATTVSAIKTKVDQYIRDTSTDSVSDANRYSAISEAVSSLYSEVGVPFSERTLALNYYDTVNTYDITSSASDFSTVVDLYRKIGDRTEYFSPKSPRDIKIEIDTGEDLPSFAVETVDQKTYLYINHASKYSSVVLHSCDAYDDNGTWTADTTNSDATNVTTDDNEYEQGNGSVNFDVDVSQSGNNRATIYNSTLDAIDLSDYEGLGSAFLRVYIPDVTEITSVSAYWGSSDSAYWTGTATTDYLGNALVDGWNRVKVDWSSATVVGTPSASAIDYLRVDVNYGASQADDTDFRIDDFRMIRPEQMTLQYTTEYVGKDSSGTALRAFTATTDVPFYSGVYDSYDIYVAHKAASILFYQMGLTADGDRELLTAEREKNKLTKKFPSNEIKPRKNFKVKGLRW